MLIRLLTVGLLLPSCQGATGPTAVPPGDTTATATPAEEDARPPGRLDELTMRLELTASSVAAGEQVGSSLVVRNDSGRTIVDPSCLLGSGRHALVPVDDPEAELWLQPVVDCAGPFEMPEGFVDRYDGPTFPARTKQGAPLPPGDYIATLEIDGSKRLEVAIEVTE